MAGVLTSLIRRLLPRSVLRDIDSIGNTAEIYLKLREADNAEADQLAVVLADAENAFVRCWIEGTPLELATVEDLRRQCVAVRDAAQEWLDANAK